MITKARLDPAKLERAFGAGVQGLELGALVPFHSSWVVVAEGTATTRHNHLEREIFVIARGEGVLEVDGERTEVAAGDVVFHHAFAAHTLRNTGRGDLLFLSVYWEALDAMQPEQERSTNARPLMVTAAPPTPNGELHVGHLSGPYVTADVVARAARLEGRDAAFVLGTDDNQSYVVPAAKKLGLEGQAGADHYAERIGRALEQVGAEVAYFGRPNVDDTHRELTREFFSRLYDRGFIVPRTTDSPYCVSCDRYLYEVYITGKCPHCGLPTGGNGCEGCARPNDCRDLAEPRCTTCGATPEMRPTTRLAFPLEPHRALLEERLRAVEMRSLERAVLASFFDRPLPELAVTHPSAWGLPVPVPGYEAQRIWVWFEMAPRYLAYAATLDRLRGGEGSFDPVFRRGDVELVQCFGVDNAFFYAVFVPALWLAYDRDVKLPVAHVMNEFYRLDGLKFSTSRNHAIWALELLPRVGADLVRFELARGGPEAAQTSFTVEGFARSLIGTLKLGWEGWIRELLDDVHARHGGVVPWHGEWTEPQRAFAARTTELAHAVRRAYRPESFSAATAIEALDGLVREAARFRASESRWAAVEATNAFDRTAVTLGLRAARTLALLVSPIMPEFGRALLVALGEGAPTRFEDEPAFVTPGARVAERPTFFPDEQTLRAALAPFDRGGRE